MRAMGSFVILSTIFLTGACATMGGLKNEPLHSGVMRVYDVPPADALRAGRDAMVGSGIEVKEVNKVQSDVWMIMGNKSAGLASYGELVRMVIEGEEAGPSTVRITTKRRMATNVFAEDDWSDSIFDQMDLELGAGREP